MAKRILILVLAAFIWGNTASIGNVHSARITWAGTPAATFTQDGILMIPELVLAGDVWAISLALISVMPTIDFIVTGVAVVTDCATWFAPAAYDGGVLDIPLLEIAGDFYEAAFVLSSLEPSILFRLAGVAYAGQEGGYSLQGSSDPYGYDVAGAGGYGDCTDSYGSYSDPYEYDSDTGNDSGYDAYEYGYDGYSDPYGASATDSYDGSDYYDANTAWEEDSAGYPGGAYENPSSNYYDYSTYEY